MQEGKCLPDLKFSSYYTGRSKRENTHTFAVESDVSSLQGDSWWDVVLIPLEGAPPPPPPAPTSLPPCVISPHIIAPLNADNWWQMDCAAHCAPVAPGDGGGPGAGTWSGGGREQGSPCSSVAPGTGGWKSIQIRPLIGPDSTRAVECGNPLSATHR